MTATRRILSVRIDEGLAEALERYCAESGATPSQVVKQGVAQYLATQSGPTLASLADAVLPAPPRAARPATRLSRQRRYRRYAREKRRR
jgi:hypothetical protein